MLNNGVPLIVVSRILGHAKPSITLDLYGHLYHEMQDEAARVMDDLVAPIEVSLPRDESPTDKLHQSAPEIEYSRIGRLWNNQKWVFLRGI